MRCSPNWLHDFHSILSFQRREITDKSKSGSFFKCRYTGMSGVLMEHLLEFLSKVCGCLNSNEFKMKLKDI